jgi:hypothetical protein
MDLQEINKLLLYVMKNMEKHERLKLYSLAQQDKGLAVQYIIGVLKKQYE